MGIHHAALDIAAAIIKDMGDEVPPESISEKEILHRRKALNGGIHPSSGSYKRQTGEQGLTKACPVRSKQEEAVGLQACA